MEALTARQRKTQEIRQHVLETVDRLFCEQGFSSLTFINISRESGISVGALQHHFGSKEQLLYEYTAAAFRRILAAHPEPLPAVQKDFRSAAVLPFSLYASFCMLVGPELIRIASTSREYDLLMDTCFDSIITPACDRCAAAAAMHAPQQNLKKLKEDLTVISRGLVLLWCTAGDSALPEPLPNMMRRIMLKFLHEGFGNSRLTDDDEFWPVLDHGSRLLG